ncbi:MAG: fibronectin type III domain-containing protein [Bacteroidota bacterium]|nr:fibronectin type III domain-containing protein [Bacteroidota bacterium]
MNTFNVLKTVALAVLISVTFVACDEDSDNPITTDPEVAAPTNLEAASADGAVFLSWTPSVDESEDNFGSYNISILNLATNQTNTTPITVGKGLSSVRIDGLTNGIQYAFTVRSVTTLGNESTDFAMIEWSPAVRNDLDNDGNLIRVYATTSSTFDSGIDLYNDAGMTEIIPQAGTEFTARGDLFVFASSSSSTLSLKSPAEANNQGLETQFSNFSPVETDDLDNQLASEPPSDGSYALKEITLDNGTVSAGRVYWGRLVRGSDYFYFRLLIKKGSNGRLVQGSGDDRYVEMVVSFQNAPNNPFAKH